MTVSALALFGAVNRANAADDGHPLVWIELGGQLAQEQTGREAYVPDFLAASPFGTPASNLEKNSRISWDGEAKVSLETGDGWIFSAAVRYGKTGRNKAINFSNNTFLA